MKPIPCWLIFDSASSTVTIESRQGARLMQIKLEESGKNTMTRINLGEDCDNFWIGFKPADSAVFNGGLFSRKKLQVNSVDFDLI